jgi:hypothetical protein
MKTLIRALSCFALIFTPVYAFWIARPIEQRVIESDCIVFAKFDGYSTVTPGELIETQLGRFVLERAVKGTAEKTFLVHGEKTKMCVPMTDFSSMQKGSTYLLFLGPADEAKTRRALEASVFELNDGKLMWSDPGEKTSQPRTLQQVERSIRSIAKAPPGQRSEIRS